MITVTRKFSFDAGHRVLLHESKCKRLHGHTYTAHVTATSRNGELDKLGRVIDFSVLKTIIGRWIEYNWDHNLLLNSDDPLLMAIPVTPHPISIPLIEIYGGKYPYIFQDQNPTAENIAKALAVISQRLLDEHEHDLDIIEVVIEETPNCKATWRKENDRIEPTRA